MIREIVEFVNINKGIEQYIDTTINGIFIYLKYDSNNFSDIKIVKSKNGNFNYFKLNSLNSLNFSNSIANSYFLKKNDLDKILDIEGKDLDTFTRRFLYYAKIYSKGKNNNFQPFNKIKSLDSTSPFFMKISFDFDGQMVFYKENRDIDISENINAHISKAIEYIDGNDEYIEFLEKMKNRLLLDIQKIKQNFILKKLLQKELKNKKDKDALTQETIHLCINVGTERQLQFDDYYLKEKAFNKKRSKMRFKISKCNCCLRENVSLSAQFLFTNYDNTFAYKNIGLDYNFTVCQDCAISLIKFWELAKQNISNPLPLIIYRNKKNLGIFSEAFKVLDKKELPKSYHNVIKELYYKNPRSLKNYYLFSFKFSGPQKKLFLNDIDYIENFQYMTNIKIENFLQLQNSFILEDFYNKNLTVFQFEKIVNELIFDKKLQNNYFSDYKKIEIKYSKLKPPKDKNSKNLLKNYLIKYRQNFYDYIYKSYQSALGLINFREMLLNIIVDDIKHDEKDKNGYSVYENEIKEKINLLFSLKNIKKEEKLQSDELIKLKEKVKKILGYWEEYKDDKKEIKNRFVEGVDHIEQNKENDKFFAFLIGQFARFLLSKSKAKKENLTHADFAGFLDWYESRLLKRYVLEIFAKYAHEFRYSRSNGKVENAISIIQTYREDLVMDEVKEYMIAGYFADNYFYEEKDKLDEEENKDE